MIVPQLNNVILNRVLLTGSDQGLLPLAHSCGIKNVKVPEKLPGDSEIGGELLLREYDFENEKFDGVIIGNSNPSNKRIFYNFFSSRGLEPLTLRGGLIGVGSTYGKGLILHYGAEITSDVRLGVCVTLGFEALVTHDVTIGDFVTVAPRALILGRVKIGAGAYIGPNATVLPNVMIGRNAIIRAGAVVTKDVADGSTVTGNPARKN